MAIRLVACFLFAAIPVARAQDIDPAARKVEYVHAVTRGAGLLPWQERGISEAEKAFRADIEARKDALLARSGDVKHPVIYTNEDLARARANAQASEWAAQWVAGQVSLADYVVAQPPGWIEAMIPEQTAAHGYGFTCPNCVGEKSQEAVGYSLARWNYREPEVITCTACGQTYPDPAYPETATLEMPRMGERITYYLNDAERANPDNRTGELAWHWVGHPIHVSFSGLIREKKIGFMRGAAESLAFAYAFTGDSGYAAAARDVLVRYAQCYRNWLYRDYWDTYADCDPIYAAWHDKSLPLEWKRHLSEQAYAKDTLEKAAMKQTYWGAGRVHPSTDAVSGLAALALAYDLTCEAADADDKPVWTADQRRLVERDLLLEYIMGAEPYIGGANKAGNSNNKAPRIYTAMAAIAKCLGIPAMADTALRGYEIVRDESFMYDGFCTESPSYNNMYLGQLLLVPESLHGFEWPADFESRQGKVDYYASDPLLRLMYRGVLWSLLPRGQYLPLSDTHVHSRPSSGIVQMGLRRYPDLFKGTVPALASATMSEYALFQLTENALKEDTGLRLPETYFPAWQTAVLRHGDGPDAATLTLALNMPGGHRHSDNLALFYDTGGRTALGDHGYVGDMPINAWIKSTYSHNLVIVDDQQQRFSERRPELEFMAASPLASVVEAASNAYEQCSEYRRRVVLLRGPQNQTLAVDLFRVTGGAKHAFRVYSEHAASDAQHGHLAFAGVQMAAEPPLPEVGVSLDREDIYGLRDVRSAAPGSPWQATWSDASGAYRLWLLSPCDRVEASNGPGQRSLKEPGRRVRYVDAVREGDNLTSAFVAVHEPSDDLNTMPVTAAELVAVPEAGARAVALTLSTAFGDFLVLHDFDNRAEVDGLSFHGVFAVIQRSDGRVTQWMTAGARELAGDGVAWNEARPVVSAPVQENSADAIVPANAPEVAWPAIAAPAQAYVRAKVNGTWTGFPVAAVDGERIITKDYPLPAVEEVALMAVGYGRL
jgi:hypothetical protein